MKVSVCIVTFEAGRWLRPCIESVLAQSHPVLEIIVVDNRSTDGTVESLASIEASVERLRVTYNDRNVGFAQGQNQAIAMAVGDAILMLNQDAELDSGFVASAVEVLERNPKVGSVQGRVRRLGPNGERTETLDTTGLVVNRDRRFLSRDQGRDDGPENDIPGFVFGADGPCPLYRRDALEDVREPRTGGGTEILDEDFFLYHEDTDLAWRLRLLGWTAWYQPSALAWHARGSAGPPVRSAAEIARHGRGMNTTARRHSWKNHRLMQFKNEQGTLFRRDLVAIVKRELGSLALLALTRPRDLRALVWLARCMPSARKKRAWIQRRRRASASEMGPWFSADEEAARDGPGSGR